MTRFVVIFLLCLGVAPLVPYLLEHRMGSLDSSERAEAVTPDKGARFEDTGAGPGERIYRTSRNRQGHFVAEANLNGHAVDMLIDTGATVTVLPESIAANVGVFLTEADYKYKVRTANGTVRAARGVIDRLRLGNIQLRNIDVLVLKDESLGEPLLGMSVLNQLQQFDMSGGTLVLVQ